jgi:hypothetical protein
VSREWLCRGLVAVKSRGMTAADVMQRSRTAQVNCSTDVPVPCPLFTPFSGISALFVELHLRMVLTYVELDGPAVGMPGALLDSETRKRGALNNSRQMHSKAK